MSERIENARVKRRIVALIATSFCVLTQRATILFGLGIGISIIQPRFIIFVLLGATIISEARLSTAECFISLFVLALLMVWPMLIPLVVFLVMGEHGVEAMQSMRSWLQNNQRKTNVVVMVIFGILLLVMGMTGIL